MDRRQVIKGIGAATAAAAVHQALAGVGAIGRAVGSVGSGAPVYTFDRFIAPNGDDNNDGLTPATAWSITALNTKSYSGLKIGIIGDVGGTQTPIQYGTVGGVQTTLYSLFQASSGNNDGSIIQVNGGTAGAPTILASCNSSGNYSPRAAIIDGSDPTGGTQPTVSAAFVGQNTYNNTSPPSNLGYVTVDGLVVRNFTHSGIIFGDSTSSLQGIVIKNCEVYNGVNGNSADNPGAIYISTSAQNFVIDNCKIHDCQTSSGTYYPWGFSGIMSLGGGTIGNSGTITNCTIYNVAQSVSTKVNQHEVSVSYCYLETGNFGNTSGGTALSYAVNGYVVPAGITVEFHHNICVGVLYGFGESGGYLTNDGTINCYNNTFYSPLSYQDAAVMENNTDGKWSFYNNIVWSDGPSPGYDNGHNTASAIYVPGLTGITTTGFDYNSYGQNTNGMTFAQSETAGQYALTLAQWQGTGYGFDIHSSGMSATPFSSTPAHAVPSSFAISSSSPAYTGGRSGAICGALDGSGTVGCKF